MMEIALIAIVSLIAIAALIVLRFVGEGALIEGVVRARQGGTFAWRIAVLENRHALDAIAKARHSNRIVWLLRGDLAEIQIPGDASTVLAERICQHSDPPLGLVEV